MHVCVGNPVKEALWYIMSNPCKNNSYSIFFNAVTQFVNLFSGSCHLCVALFAFWIIFVGCFACCLVPPLKYNKCSHHLLLHQTIYCLHFQTLRHVNICDRFRKIKNTPTKGWVCRPWNTSQGLKSFEVPGLVLTVRLKCQGGVFPLFCSVTQQQLRAQWMTWIAAIKARKHHRCDGTCSSDTHNGNKTEKDKIETTKWR